jgi:hypothetical protein
MHTQGERALGEQMRFHQAHRDGRAHLVRPFPWPCGCRRAVQPPAEAIGGVRHVVAICSDAVDLSKAMGDPSSLVLRLDSCAEVCQPVGLPVLHESI